MGFEDDIDYNNSFETDMADLDGDGLTEKPKKLSRKELREAKKRNAEKTAEFPKKKKGLFSRRERMDDDDSMGGQHFFDPTQDTKISTPREHKSDYDTGPIRNYNSEFSYLFDPVDDDETEDDVYPDESIYSDSSTARDLLGGLAYDETKDGDSTEYDKYFDENTEVRPPSKFSFHRREERQRAEKMPIFEDNLPDIEEEPPAPAEPIKVVPHPVVRSEEPEADSYLPDLRPDSVFAPKSEQPPAEPSYSAAEPRVEEREESYMPQDNNDFQQDYMPYQTPSVYQPYPMQPMNQMMGYPVIMPNSGQAQGMPYQAIPIPYPMPMPMPYPMYSQGYYPPYPPGYPPYGGDYYGRYDGRYAPPPHYDDRYDDRRRSSRGYDDRYDVRRGPEGHYDPYYGERYDERGYRERESYPRPPYQPPYDRDDYNRRGAHDDRNAQYPPQGNAAQSPEPTAAPIYTPQPEQPAAAAPINPEPIKPAESYEPITSSTASGTENNFSSFDFTFNKPAEDTANQPVDNFSFGGFEQNDLEHNNFGTDGFEPNNFGANEFGGSDFNNFGSDNVSGFENYSDSGNDFSFNFDDNTNNTDTFAELPVEEGKPRGGRFKKRR